MCDQQPTFDWDQARKEIEKSHTAITEAKINMIKLKTNIFQKMFDCDALRQRLIILLEKMEVQIKVAGKYLQFKANQFKNKLTKIIFSKYFEKIKKYYDVIFEICAVVFLLSATLLGLEYIAVISTLSTTAKTYLKRSLFLSGIGLTIYAVDTLYQVYQAFKNKQIFQQAIKQTQKALNQIQKLKKDLQ